MLTFNIRTLDFLLVFTLVHPDFLLLSNQLLNQPVLLIDLRGTYEDHLCLLFQLGSLLLVFSLDFVNLHLLDPEAGLQSLDVVLEPLHLRLSIFRLSARECLCVHFRHRFSLRHLIDFDIEDFLSSGVLDVRPNDVDKQLSVLNSAH